jgi:myo-inositol-1(or 4)-monophosphatase
LKTFLKNLILQAGEICKKEQKLLKPSDVDFKDKKDELFFAEKNNKAFLNDLPICVTQTDKLVNCVMATGFACLRANLSDNNLKYFNKIAPQLRDIRRYGSAAIDLCYVACGRFDGFWEMNLNLYDIAAGAFIVEQAGGVVCDFNGNSNFPDRGIIASNKNIQKDLLDNFN